MITSTHPLQLADERKCLPGGICRECRWEAIPDRVSAWRRTRSCAAAAARARGRAWVRAAR